MIAFIALFLVSGFPVAISIAPDERGAFKLTHLIDGAEFLVFGFFDLVLRLAAVLAVVFGIFLIVGA